MEVVKEGAAKIVVRDGVFYNPKMEELRDISVAFLKAIDSKNKTLLDSTAATGIRGIRYALEAGVKEIEFLDINRNAYLNTKLNMKRNGIKAGVSNISIQAFASTKNAKFDIIDLDPFGTPSPYIFDVLKLCKDSTVLMITATDTAVLCGAHELACIRVYGSKPMHSVICHEVGTRILVDYVARTAAQFAFGVEPLLVISRMHYIRVFLRLRVGAREAVKSLKTTGFGTFCRRCQNFGYVLGLAPAVSTECEYCGSRMEAFGPLWLGSLYDKKLLARINSELRKNNKRDSADFLGLLKDELDIPFFYSLPRITKSLRMSSVSPRLVMDRLGKRYRVSKTQFDQDGLKTDAGIKEVIRTVKHVSRVR